MGVLKKKGVEWNAGKPNMPGLTGFILIIAQRDILTFPTLDDDKTETTGNLVLKTGALMEKVYCTLGTGMANSTAQGERDGRSFKNSVGWNSPGNDPDNLSVANRLLNGPYVVLAKDTDRRWKIIGDLDFGAYSETIEVTTAKAGTEKRGVEYLISSESPYAAPFYKGTFTGLVLDSPYALDATSVLTTGFTANWEAVAGITTFMLDVSTRSDFATFVAGYEGKEVTGVSSAVTGLTTGTQYFYRLRTKKGLFESFTSNEVPVKTA